MNKLNLYLRYVSTQLKGYSLQIKELLESEQNILFDAHKGVFTIINENLTPEERVDIHTTLKEKLSEVKPLTSVKVDDLMMGYYDQCLERYLYERLNRLKPNEETCWFKYAQNNKCVGWIDANSDFGVSEKEQLLFKLKRHDPYYKDDKLVEFLERDSDGYVYVRSANIYKDDCEILHLCRSIKENGFSNIESSFIPIILGYSKKTGCYNVISGRQRVAVLRYLRTQGLINGSLKIKCHLIEYPFESLMYTRPYDGTCKGCNWGGIYDPGKGTHQDYFVQEGTAMMRGRHNRKGGRQKWNRIHSIFQKMVSNKRVLDIGAHRGLYCIKALEYGANHVTALDPEDTHIDVMDIIRKNYVLDDLNVIKGNFYNDDDYDSLVRIKFDTVFLFGIVHHLLRLGIQQGILFSFDELFQRIFKIAGYGVIVEFAMRTEKSLDLPELVPYRAAFSQRAFEKALKKYYPKFVNLGRCKYRSGNEYGRFMYYGTVE